MQRLTDFRIIEEHPTFPNNSLGLKLGTQITAASGPEENFGLEPGVSVPIYYDGSSICVQQVRWDIASLISDIQNGTWSIGQAPDLAGEELYCNIFNNQRIVTPEHFWKYLWPQLQDVVQGEQFVLRHDPSVDPELIRQAGIKAGYRIEVDKKIEAVQRSESGQGFTITVVAGDAGHLEGGMELGLGELLSGDAFCIFSLHPERVS